MAHKIGPFSGTYLSNHVYRVTPLIHFIKLRLYVQGTIRGQLYPSQTYSYTPLTSFIQRAILDTDTMSVRD